MKSILQSILVIAIFAGITTYFSFANISILEYFGLYVSDNLFEWAVSIAYFETLAVMYLLNKKTARTIINRRI